VVAVPAVVVVVVDDDVDETIIGTDRPSGLKKVPLAFV